MEISTGPNTGKDSDDDELIHNILKDDILILSFVCHRIKFIDIHKWQATDNLEE
jgi:hypothetical protein